MYLSGVVLHDYHFRNAAMERLIKSLNLIGAFPTSKEIDEIYAKKSTTRHDFQGTGRLVR
jgi:hypothetical protein